MRLVYTHDNFALVGLARGLLEEAGLEVMVKNEFTSNGFPPYNLIPEIWVLNDSDFDAANRLLADLGEQDLKDS